MKNKALTLTIISNITSNYGEGLGNVSTVQKVFRNGKVYATRSRESLKNAIMVQSGLYDDLKVTVDGAAQKLVNDDVNISNCKALEGGYMNTSGTTNIRKSSFYLTDAVSCDEFVNETRFHNNLYLATAYAKENKINFQAKKDRENEDKKENSSGLMPYQYEFDKSLKKYSITIDLDKIGVDENSPSQADTGEKIQRVLSILKTIQNLSLIVKGNMDNAEPLLIFGGIGEYKTHYFDNVVNVKRDTLNIENGLKDRVKNGYRVGLLRVGNFINEEDIVNEFSPLSISEFFKDLEEDVKSYYEE